MRDGRAPTSGIIVIPPAKRFPYGDDLAAARSAGRARASVRRRVGHLIERPSGDRAARVSRCEAIRTSSGNTAVARAGDRPASQGRTRAATPMKPLGVAVQHLTNPSHRRTMSQGVSCPSQLDSNPEVSGKAGAVQKRLIDVSEQGVQRRWRVSPVVLEPPPKERVEPMGNVSQRQLCLTAKIQVPNHRPHGLHRRGADCGLKPQNSVLSRKRRTRRGRKQYDLVKFSLRV